MVSCAPRPAHPLDRYLRPMLDILKTAKLRKVFYYYTELNVVYELLEKGLRGEAEKKILSMFDKIIFHGIHRTGFPIITWGDKAKSSEDIEDPFFQNLYEYLKHGGQTGDLLPLLDLACTRIVAALEEVER